MNPQQKDNEQQQEKEPTLMVVGNTTSGVDKLSSQERVETIKNLAFFSITAVLAKGLSVSLRNPEVSKFFRINTLTHSLSPELKKEVMDNKTLSTVITNILQNVEEMSPFKILRSIQASNLMTPAAMSGVDIDIPGRVVSGFESTYDAILKNRGVEGIEQGVTSKNLVHGFRIKDKVMYEIEADGKTGKAVMNNASFMWTHTMIGDDPEASSAIFKNRIANQYHSEISGSEVDTLWKGKRFSTDGIAVIPIGGNSKTQVATDMFKSYFRTVLESAGSAIDNPAEEVIGMIPAIKGTSLEKFLKNLPKPNLWTGGNYRGTISESFSGGLKSAYKAVGIAVAAKGLDLLVRNEEEEGLFGKGLVAGVSTLAVNADILSSEILWDRFQGYKENQEKYAPGSTSLLAMAGIPLALGSSAGVAVFAKKSFLSLKYGAKSARAMTDISWSKSTKKWAKIGALMEAPFIPGAIIGDSSEEKKAVYSGEKKVEIRKNRWWGSGSTEFEGQSIRFFDTHAYSKMMNNVDLKAEYGDLKTKSALSAILHPFDYLRDPYKYEKLHEKDRPYPVWGMDVSEGMIFGKVFQNTLGRIIKPDVVNEKLYSLNEVDDESMSAVGEASVVKDSEDIKVTKPVTEDEASLIAEGKLVSERAVGNETLNESLRWSEDAAKDFGGLKGYIAGVLQSAVGLESPDMAENLARSGEMHNLARQIKDMEINGLFGLTEGLRRYVPVSAGTLPERYNPLKNDQPSWMPGKEDEFYLDFSTGDPYAEVQRGNSRVAGAGYEALNPELQGISKEDYPDIHKFAILADVALGSKSYYRAKDMMTASYEKGEMTDYEKKIFEEVEDQTTRRGATKTFSELLTDEELSGANAIDRTKNKYWEILSHKLEQVSTTEALTFWRPAGKLVHKRTAVEDYRKTQLGGSDMALWDTPLESFIKPAINDSARTLDKNYESQNVKEDRRFSEYFDKLEYVKQRRANRSALSSGDQEAAQEARSKASRTRVGSRASRMDDDTGILQAMLSMEKDDRPYFGSFSSAKGEKRDEILDIVSDDIAPIYAKIWNRKDILDKVTAAGGSNEEARYAVNRQADLEQQNQISSNREEFDRFMSSKAPGDNTSFSEHIAEKSAEAYIEDTGGMPDQDFSGWDPRIDTKKVKLRALQLGGDDFYKHGFWKSDTNELKRYVSVNEDQNIERITENLRSSAVNRERKRQDIKQSLSKDGYVVDDVYILDNEDRIDIGINHA